MLRDIGISYRELEKTGLMLVVRSMQVEFHVPAEFDDELELWTTVLHCHGARIEHRYELFRNDPIPVSIATAVSEIACVDRDGKVRRLPRELQMGKK